MTPLLAMPPQLLLLARPPRVSSNGRPAEEGAESNPKSCIEESPTPSRRMVAQDGVVGDGVQWRAQ